MSTVSGERPIFGKLQQVVKYLNFLRFVKSNEKFNWHFREILTNSKMCQR